MARKAPEAQTEDKTDPHGLFEKILFEINSIRDLSHFIATARFAYQRFSVQSRAVLFRVLQNELDPALADARFLFVFPYSNPTDQVRNTEDGMPIQGDALPHLEEIKALCRTLHQINFIADMYVTAQLASFDLGGRGGTPAAVPLSPLERRRLVRSFYRRQILSNAWAATRRPKHWTHEDTAAISNSSTHQGEELGLLGTLEPWEMQQIKHVDVFITHLCLALVHHFPRTADGAPGIPPRQFDELFAHLHRLIQFLQTHRGVTERAARDLTTAMELAYYARLHGEYVNPYQMIPLRLAWQSDRTVNFPDPVETNGLDLPPYGWLDALGGRYVKWFGEGLYSIPWRQSNSPPSDQSNALYLWRYSGFCLWDRKRVEALKG
ncbi:hypothetical protein P885DRAFT_73118 [Corynascus similis CBS 632.67]